MKTARTKQKQLQTELAATADVFNLASETGDDPDRLSREAAQVLANRQQAEYFSRKHQQQLL